VVALYLFLFSLPNLTTNILTLSFDNFSFWTLTANPDAYRHQAALDLAEEKGLTPEGLFYAFCMSIGISPMDGATNEIHMREDIDLMNRIRDGEQIFSNIEELAIVGDALGTPGWNAEEDEL